MYDTKYYLVTRLVKKNLLLNEGCYTSYWKSYRRKKLKRPCFFSNLFMRWVFEKWRKYFQDGILSFLWVPVMWPQMKKNQSRFEILFFRKLFFSTLHFDQIFMQQFQFSLDHKDEENCSKDSWKCIAWFILGANNVQ